MLDETEWLAQKSITNFVTVPKMVAAHAHDDGRSRRSFPHGALVPATGEAPVTPPLSRLMLAVGLMAAGMLLLEVLITRFFSVMFLYHYSFFAVCLVMSGLALGGLMAARWNAPAMSGEEFRTRLTTLASAFSALSVAALVVLVTQPVYPMTHVPGMAAILFPALAFLPGLVCAGGVPGPGLRPRSDRDPQAVRRRPPDGRRGVRRGGGDHPRSPGAVLPADRGGARVRGRARPAAGARHPAPGGSADVLRVAGRHALRRRHRRGPI